jgi:hypothetical protein
LFQNREKGTEGWREEKEERKEGKKGSSHEVPLFIS